MELITLPDGRTLAYAQYGDPRGKPVFFFHGTPGSYPFHPDDEVTKRLGVRLITSSRPGYGASTFQPGRRLLDWPKDVAALADALHIDRFHIAGHSGGCPHTLACCYAMPERVIAAATLSGAGPVETPGATEGMIFLNRIGFKYGQYFPWPVLYAIAYMSFKKRSVDPEGVMRSETGKRPPADDKIFESRPVWDMCVETEKEAFRQGLRPMVWEVRLITSPWGFPIEQIQTPIQLWHGSADDVASVNMAHYMAKKLPHNHLTVCPDEGHMLLLPHWEEILKALIAQS